jgi:hypothetical protein
MPGLSVTGTGNVVECLLTYTGTSNNNAAVTLYSDTNTQLATSTATVGTNGNRIVSVTAAPTAPAGARCQAASYAGSGGTAFAHDFRIIMSTRNPTNVTSSRGAVQNE